MVNVVVVTHAQVAVMATARENAMDAVEAAILHLARTCKWLCLKDVLYLL